MLLDACLDRLIENSDILFGKLAVLRHRIQEGDLSGVLLNCPACDRTPPDFIMCFYDPVYIFRQGQRHIGHHIHRTYLCVFTYLRKALRRAQAHRSLARNSCVNHRKDSVGRTVSSPRGRHKRRTPPPRDPAFFAHTVLIYFSKIPEPSPSSRSIP